MHDDFYRGVAVCLTVLAADDQERPFREIVAACDRDRLLRVARRDGVLRLSGFTKYGIRLQGPARPSMKRDNER